MSVQEECQLNRNAKEKQNFKSFDDAVLNTKVNHSSINSGRKYIELFLGLTIILNIFLLKSTFPIKKDDHIPTEGLKECLKVSKHYAQVS